jgi:hypothetical protein
MPRSIAAVLVPVLAFVLFACVTNSSPYKNADTTHIISTATPYYSSSPAQASAPDGTLALGREVVLIRSEGSYSLVRVRDTAGQPSEVWVETENLLAVSR